VGYRNTTREEVIHKIQTILESIDSIKTVVRRMPSYEDLQRFAVTQFPVVAMVCGLPVPNEKESARIPAALDLVISELKIELYCYLMDASTMDSSISEMLEKIWIALYADPTQGGLVLGTLLKPEAATEVWEPFGAFKIDVLTKYVHTTGGI
jgi:hypothetical protein